MSSYMSLADEKPSQQFGWPLWLAFVGVALSRPLARLPFFSKKQS